MKRVASLFLPMLPIERLRRLDRSGRSEPPPDRPLVTTERQGQRVVLAAVCPLARSLGLQHGMPLTQARALVPGLDIRPSDPEADKAVLLRLALFAARLWTPFAAVDEPDGLWLDISGCAHLFGGERRLCERILRTCRRAGFSARIAVAGTTGAAHALVRFGGEDIALCPNGREAETISALPPQALRIEEEAASACRRFGIDCIGELTAMPRGPLARRFGNALLTRLDQALGRTAETFHPIIPRQSPAAILRFLEPISSAEAIEQVIGDLASMLSHILERQGLGARRIKLTCDRVDGDEQSIVTGLARATRDSAHLASLLRMKIEQVEPGFGIETMRLIATRYEPLPARQIGSLEEDCEAEIPPLVDRIASRIGTHRVFQISSVESDVPERSVRQSAPLAHTRNWPSEWPRPVRLLARPERVDKVIAELPDQPPLRFSWRGETHRIRKADGPERIYGEWWKHVSEADAVRDYFQVEDESGARFWLFRRGDGFDPRTGDLSWYIHGVFG
jgi:protein ImuB